MLLAAFALFVAAVLVYVFASKAREQPAGSRGLWLAAVLTLGAAGATNGEHVATPIKIGAWLVGLTLLALCVRAQNRAGDGA